MSKEDLSLLEVKFNHILFLTLEDYLKSLNPSLDKVSHIV
jgi:hypothetical protein